MYFGRAERYRLRRNRRWVGRLPISGVGGSSGNPAERTTPAASASGMIVVPLIVSAIAGVGFDQIGPVSAIAVLVGCVALFIGYTAEQVAHAQEAKDAIDAGEI